ncbi:MAG: hypothetical protein ACRCXZ_05950 [Patescibacteria group bacterium]
MKIPDIIVQIYDLITAAYGWTLFLILPLTILVMLVRGFGVWKISKGDWQAVGKSIESVATILIVIVVCLSV